MFFRPRLMVPVLALGAAPLIACASSGSGQGMSSGIVDSSVSTDVTLGQDASPDAGGGDSSLGGDTGPGVVGGGVIPTTCAQANGTPGCCGPDGQNYYCSTADGGMTVKSKMCASGTVCGWNATKGYYGCVMPPAMADPSGAAPIACGAGAPATDSGSTVVDSGGKDSSATDSSTAGGDGSTPDSSADSSPPGDAGPGTIPTTCSEANGGEVGCCGPNGEEYYCSDGGPLTGKACAAGLVCGWNIKHGYYGCVAPPATSDPSGTYPMACQ